MTSAGDAYEFAFRGLLTEEALDGAGRPWRIGSGMFEADVVESVSLAVLDEDRVSEAKVMAAVYVAIAAFENAARQFVTTVLREAAGDDWWDTTVSSTIRTRCASREADEAKHRFHTQRGSSPINYTDLGQLGNIIKQNPQHFVPDFLPTVEWAAAIFDAVERSRNVIMHSGTLDAEDVARLGINIRDWVKQVGA